MLHLSNQAERILAVVLTVCISVCCCHAHFIMEGTGDGEATATTAACCGGCADECPAEPQEDRPDAPPKGCKVCCIKGTGLKDAATALPAATAPLMPVFTPPATRILPASHRHHPCCRADGRLVHVEPRTLLRLRCALIV